MGIIIIVLIIALVAGIIAVLALYDSSVARWNSEETAEKVWRIRREREQDKYE